MKKANFRLLNELPTFKKNTSLVIFWNETLPVIRKVFDQVALSFQAKPFCMINPDSFHSMDGVIVSGNVAALPEISFWAGQRDDLILLTSAQPQLDYFGFFSLVFDFAVKHCNVETIYTVDSFFNVCAHSAPRSLVAVYNTEELKTRMHPLTLAPDIDIISQGPLNRPSMSSFLAWAAIKRNLQVVNLWVMMPFYLSTIGDPMGERALLGNLEKVLNIKADYTLLDSLITEQYSGIELLCSRSVDACDIIDRIANGDTIAEEESALLVNEIEDFFIK